MSSTTPEVKKPRLTTSAMIASIANEGQRVRAAPFGHALVQLAEAHPEIVGMTAEIHRSAFICPGLSGTIFPDGYG